MDAHECGGVPLTFATDGPRKALQMPLDADGLAVAMRPRASN